ncbi:hypothetical protein [Geoglobus acetivorans]|uniref:Uncharacterized protein n=1 Tax=Geoglobus acetivorans TaxID=565033 RepID=A0A0A7GE80_GEOAI|nr:hypothetical protein GACE_1129 [Geoglobus acetivorans]
MEIRIKVPQNVSEELAKLIAETIASRLSELRWVNEVPKSSELTEEDALELGRRTKKGRGEHFERKYISGG